MKKPLEGRVALVAGATRMERNQTVWESSLDYGLGTRRLAVDTHAITSTFALPLLIEKPGGLAIEVNDGTGDYNPTHYRVSFFYGSRPDGWRYLKEGQEAGKPADTTGYR